MKRYSQIDGPDGYMDGFPVGSYKNYKQLESGATGVTCASNTLNNGASAFTLRVYMCKDLFLAGHAVYLLFVMRVIWICRKSIYYAIANIIIT